MEPKHGWIEHKWPVLLNLERLRNELHRKDGRGRKILRDPLADPEQEAEALQTGIGVRS
jgi:hypothetical protein